MGGISAKGQRLLNLRKSDLSAGTPLITAQSLKITSCGQTINPVQTEKILTNQELDRMRRRRKISLDVRIILNEPFSRVDRITDSLYLTGIAGLTIENLTALKITCIINATYEMPLAVGLKGIESWRVPVEDEEREEILIYFEDVADKINSIAKAKGRTVVHCMAGASRSSTLVIAYLIKYQSYTLKEAFCYLKSMRPCARPNIGFFEQLIIYEGFYRRDHSVRMIEVRSRDESKSVARVPDFYATEFRDLYKVEVAKQFTRASQITLQQSNRNYINRARDYGAMERDVEMMRAEIPSHDSNPPGNHSGGLSTSPKSGLGGGEVTVKPGEGGSGRGTTGGGGGGGGREIKSTRVGNATRKGAAGGGADGVKRSPYLTSIYSTLQITSDPSPSPLECKTPNRKDPNKDRSNQEKDQKEIKKNNYKMDKNINYNAGRKTGKAEK